jgi:hypothetical protein
MVAKHSFWLWRHGHEVLWIYLRGDLFRDWVNDLSRYRCLKQQYSNRNAVV